MTCSPTWKTLTQTVHDDRFARAYALWRPVVARVAEKLLACGVLEHGLARIRCDACAHEYLLAFSCKCRYFCHSGHAKRLAIWTQWLDTTRVGDRRIDLREELHPAMPRQLRADRASLAHGRDYRRDRDPLPSRE